MAQFIQESGSFAAIGFDPRAEEFLSGIYSEDREHMPKVNSRHEAYGILAAQFQQVAAGLKAIKADMDDCLKALAVNDDAFQAAVNTANQSLVDVVASAATMYELGRHVSEVMNELVLANHPAPLYDMAMEAELPGSTDGEA